MTKIFSKLIIICVPLIIAFGCATIPMETLRVTVTDNGRIMVSDKYVSLDKVASAVKRAGARQNTMIEIQVPSKTSASLGTSIKSNLARAGYPKIFFVKRKQAAAYVNKENEKSGFKKPAPSVPRIRRR